MKGNSSSISNVFKKKKMYNNENNKNKENLIDSSWEIIHPTPPNIYTLFVQFDKQFFWNKLRPINVKWSKKMTSCAGTCTFRPGIGECTVALSEPLLKLRPRKDLIQTLLHEMIHAYLFITDNDRDRDDHGPEFHKHMHRINNKAGTNISVYHDFHDEVRLYKTHWWRCNGLCKNRPPFFGLIKRATNRAPGPYDRWWADHQITCNGKFEKIREPDKSSKKTGELATKSVPIIDNRKFFNKTNSNKDKTDFNHLRINNFKSFFGSAHGSNSKWHSSESKPTSSKNFKNDCIYFDEIFNGSSDKELFETTITMENKFKEPSKNDRNFWINKYSDKNKKRHTSQPINEIPVIDLCVDEETISEPINEIPVIDLCVDEETMSESINEIPVIDLCVDEETICPICSKSFKASEINEHINTCLESSFKDDFEGLEDTETINKLLEKQINCYICNESIIETQLNVHLETCVKDVFEDEIIAPETFPTNEFENEIDIPL